MLLSAATLLTVWETATGRSLTEWVLRLLAHSRPDIALEEWAEMPVGQRDAGLLALREELFGPRLEATAICPHCGDRIEATFGVDDVRVPNPPTLSEPIRVAVDDYEIECRLVTSLDLLTAASADAEGRATVLRRCVRVTAPTLDVDPAALPAAAMQTVLQEMAAADPQADVQIELSCPACAHRWLMPFDIVSYLWSEVDDLAQRLVREVHVLASTYGWREHDILAMNARRRRLYLEMAGA